MKVKVKKLSEKAAVPKYAKQGDAGLDLTATSYKVDHLGNHVYGTGLAFEIPEGNVGLLFPRSSVSKTRLTLRNSVGVVDSGYRGEVSMKFSGGMPYVIGDRIGQLIIMPYPQIELVETEELSVSERGDGSYGSTGK